MATLEELTTAAQTEIDARKTANGGDGMFAQVNNERREFTDAEYDQAVTDKANYDYDQQENGYKSDRQQAYKSIAEQLDMIYWDGVNGTTLWDEHIAEVKEDNPKPE
tara:strand:- start:3235 stop:3555 length:321 start_codon:yes stop_codon:yes gene_type:complete